MAGRATARRLRIGRWEMQSGSTSPQTVSPFKAIAVAIFVTLGLLYIVSQFLRNSVAVIAPNLTAEMGLTPIQIGLLSSVYFFFFAVLQLPLGVALDRYGPKLCMVVSAVVTGIGAVGFGIARDAGDLVTARALLGFGTASFLMAPVALYARWFAPERFSTLAGIQLGVGSLGAIFATAPLAWATQSFGWRTTFIAVGIFTIGLTLLILLIVSDDPPGVKREPHKETLREAIAGIWQVIRTPSMGRIFLIQLSSYPSYVLVVGLWGGPYLTHIYGYDLSGRGEVLLIAALCQVAGSFFWAPGDRIFGRYKVPILMGTAICFTSLLILAVIGNPPTPLLLLAFAMIGLSTGMASLVLSHGRSLVPPRLLGRTITLLNIGTMGGGFLVQFISGAVIDLFPVQGSAYPLEAYQVVFGLQALLILICGIAYLGSQDSYLARR